MTFKVEAGQFYLIFICNVTSRVRWKDHRQTSIYSLHSQQKQEQRCCLHKLNFVLVIGLLNDLKLTAAMLMKQAVPKDVRKAIAGPMRHRLRELLSNCGSMTSISIFHILHILRKRLDLGLSWEDLGATWVHLGAMMGQFGAILGLSWEDLGATWVHFGA